MNYCLNYWLEYKIGISTPSLTTSSGFFFSSAYTLSTIPFQNAFFKLICSYSIGLYWCITSSTDLLIQPKAAIKSAEGGSHQGPYAAIYDHTEQMGPKTPADFAAFYFFCSSRKGTAYGMRSGRYKSRSCLHNKIFILHLSADQAEFFQCSHAAAQRTHQSNSTIGLTMLACWAHQALRKLSDSIR